ncbi:hypothetical protein AXE80_05100 [Wenyingzhuangia fucanilytica]|uniref:TonB-dependent receptor plug domain-containing protein n=1 Tax=Wenyingzhuangia fucanilytica TaxID=1790137 RepID=A0A1B1Y4I5_9FLAO|nr:hypothetical protein [Wenyingzhuangia fucanilytica]ANW95691.1 hypothetical protein AXE80_05100 [Wenyingzhuangia fucanilytica]
MLNRLFLILILTPLCNYAQTSFPNQIQKNLEDYIFNQYPEKTYVHTDKPAYTLGEDIWFSAYLINGITHRRTPKSRILYVELINPENKIVDKKTLYVYDINVAGDFKILEDWQEGKYTIRAYTNYMRNDSSDTFFQKKIPIYKINKDSNIDSNNIDSVSSSTQTTEKDVPKPEVSFYPEGGYLIEGLQNRVAFKTNVKNFKAYLKDQKGNEIAEAKSIDLGLGLLSIIPEKNKSYYVSTTINGKEIKYPLPKALPKGFVINTTNTKNGIIVNLNSNMPNGLQNTFLIAHQRGILFYNNFETQNIPSNTLKIPTSYLTDGVVNITLFNSDGNPVAERTIFVDTPKDNLKLTTKTSKETYKSREKVEVLFDLTDINGEKETSTFSMSVRDLKAFPYNTRTSNIKTYLLLNSDLRGTIEQPGYFFEKENDPKRKYLLDLVMMTNGWKRFTSLELLQTKKEAQKYSPENSLFITGTTTKFKKLDKPHVSEVRLTFLGKVFAQEPIQKTDSLGRFKFGPYTFMDSISTIIEARYDNFNSKSLKTKDVSIVLDEPTASPPVTSSKEASKLSTYKKNENFVKVAQYVQQIKFEYNQKVEQLKAVELNAINATAAEKRKKEMENRTIYRRPDNMMNRIDVTSLEFTPTTIIELLNTNANHVIREDFDNFLWNRDNSIVRIFLDGRQITMDYLRSITCDEISFVDILTGATVNMLYNDIAGGTGGAAIILYPKKGYEFKNGKKIEKPGVLNFKAKGFYTAREFFSPDHIKDFDELKGADLRTTLHWEPMLKTTKETPTKVSFFTSDIKSDYIIEIEGISSKGQPIHTFKTFNVE